MKKIDKEILMDYLIKNSEVFFTINNISFGQKKKNLGVFGF